MEVFSPPRLRPQTNRFGLVAGPSIDSQWEDPVTHRRYDLLNAKDQGLVKGLSRKWKPLVLAVGPPCTYFSTLQAMNPAKKSHEWAVEYRKALELLRCSCELAAPQVKSGRYLVLKHPRTASSWNTEYVRDLLCMERGRSDLLGHVPIWHDVTGFTGRRAIVEANEIGEQCTGNPREGEQAQSRRSSSCSPPGRECRACQTIPGGALR